VKLLAIDTATPCASCALWADDGPVAASMVVAGQRHAEVLMPAIDELCRRAGWSVSDLDGVAVDIGPGLFTGLRVGLATASAIARARGIPAAGVTSLEALAHPHRRRPGTLVPVVDARRGEVYRAVFRSDGAAMKEVLPPALATPEKLADELAALASPALASPGVANPGVANPGVANPGVASTGLANSGPSVLVLGDGAWRYRGLLEASGGEVAGSVDRWPSALSVAELATDRLAGTGPNSGATVDPAPLYLRHADVRIGWEEVGGRVSGPAPASVAAASPPREPKLAP
jgi:tRNA threonylcarbamoyladenosine biosynthesis protein TsaB